MKGCVLDILEHGDLISLKGSPEVFRYNGYDESIENLTGDEVDIEAMWYPDGQHQVSEDLDIMKIIRNGVVIWKIERDEDERDCREVFSY